MRLAQRSLAAAEGVLADLALGEPTVQPHPVSAFGGLMHTIEGRLYRDRRAEGTRYTAIGLALGAGTGALLGASTAATATATYISVAGRALVEAARHVGEALGADDLDTARARLLSLVGRDASRLDAGEVVRAVVESVAENTVDAIVAPALWGAAAGAPGALGYRAVNTMDATVGHRSERYLRFGWASARLDDLANLVPARLTAALVAAVRPRAAGAVWRAVRQQAPAHPSPNAGVAEAAFAAALGLRLGGVNTYGTLTERRPVLGTGRSPAAADIEAAVTLCRDVTYALVALLVLLGLAT